MSFRRFCLWILLSVFAIAFVVSCDDERIATNSCYKLDFSSDTVSFDTIFSTIPSITHSIKVYNPNSQSLNIAKIWLDKGESSCFRFNANGFSAEKNNSLENIEIKAQDSIFVFVETTLNPNNHNSPVYVSENLFFETNGNRQSVVLEAYGQDAVVLRNHSIVENTTFSGDKAYLIFGYLHIPPSLTLTLEAGTRIFMHRSDDFVINTGYNQLSVPNTSIIVEGNIVSNGTTARRVSVRGDRSDMAYTNIPYSYLPSQWGALYLLGGNNANSLLNTDLVGGTMGCVVIGSQSLPVRLQVENSVIHSMSSYGILSRFGDVVIANSEISNCGASAVAQLGGTLLLSQSTIANYLPHYFSSGNPRIEPALNIISFVRNQSVVSPFPVESSVVENCIIYGNMASEIALRDTNLNIPFNVYIKDCVIKSNELHKSYLHNIYWGQENNVFAMPYPDFTKTDEREYFNFSLAEKSPAIGIANFNVATKYPFDLKGSSRLADTKPDIGAYERHEE